MRPDKQQAALEEEDVEPVAPAIDQAETKRVKLRNGIEPGFEPDFDEEPFFLPKHVKLQRGMSSFWKRDLLDCDNKSTSQLSRRNSLRPKKGTPSDTMSSFSRNTGFRSGFLNKISKPLQIATQ